MRLEMKMPDVYHADNGQTHIFRECQITGAMIEIIVDSESYLQWKRGMLIQVAFPKMNAEDREFIISGWTAQEWEHLCGLEDDNLINF